MARCKSLNPSMTCLPILVLGLSKTVRIVFDRLCTNIRNSITNHISNLDRKDGVSYRNIVLMELFVRDNPLTLKDENVIQYFDYIT